MNQKVKLAKAALIYRTCKKCGGVLKYNNAVVKYSGSKNKYYEHICLDCKQSQLLLYKNPKVKILEIEDEFLEDTKEILGG